MLLAIIARFSQSVMMVICAFEKLRAVSLKALDQLNKEWLTRLHTGRVESSAQGLLEELEL